MASSLVWLEIGASDIHRAVRFYENVFNIKLDVKLIYDKPMAFFLKDDLGIKGSIVEKTDHIGGSGITPMIFVHVLHTILDKVQRFGGSVVNPPMIMRQKNKNGETIIGSNLIDGQMGYYAEIKDTEGNSLFLYSHS